MQHPISLAAVAAAAFLALSACGTSPEEPGDEPATTDAAEPEFGGTWLTDDPEGAGFTLEQVDDGGGTLNGTDGCNGMGGDFFIDGDTARVDLGPSTLKGCVGVDTWLRGTATVVVDGDTMTVQDSNGEEIGTLTRDEDADEDAIPTITPTASIDEAEDDSDS